MKLFRKPSTKSLDVGFPAQEALDFMGPSYQLAVLKSRLAGKHLRDETAVRMKAIPPS